MKILEGDLLAVQGGTILHQVNCRGVVGGLAGALRKAHPGAFVDYFLLCEKYGARNLGTYRDGHVNRALTVVHIFGQIEPGANTILAAVQMALREFAISRVAQRPIYAPYGMGCGIGGGNWCDYQRALEDAIPDIVLVKLPRE